MLGNPFIGAEGWSILQEAAHAGSVKSLCGLSAGQTAVDFSRLKLGLSDYTMLAAEFTCEVFRGVDRIDLGGFKAKEADGVAIRKGAVAALDGRLGEIVRIVRWDDEDEEYVKEEECGFTELADENANVSEMRTKLRWLDDGTTGDFVDAELLT